jgi:CheY-like chemotaxis protein
MEARNEVKLDKLKSVFPWLRQNNPLLKIEQLNFQSYLVIASPAFLLSMRAATMLKLKILIVDDESDYCAIMKSYFEDRNYEVFLAGTLNEAMELLDKNSPDILFLDNNLPDGRGWNHIDNMIGKNPSLRLFLISAYNQKLNLSTNGQIIIWEKPISLNLLNQHF